MDLLFIPYTVVEITKIMYESNIERTRMHKGNQLCLFYENDDRLLRDHCMDEFEDLPNKKKAENRPKAKIGH